MRINRHTFRPIYGDTDMMGVVYYANYLRYFEAGRTEFLRAAGIEYKQLEQNGYALPVARAAVKYHKPAYYDDELTLETKVEEVRFTSVRITYRLVRNSDDVLVATGETMHAFVDRSGRVSRIPDDVRAKLEHE